MTIAKYLDDKVGVASQKKDNGERTGDPVERALAQGKVDEAIKVTAGNAARVMKVVEALVDQGQTERAMDLFRDAAMNNIFVDFFRSKNSACLGAIQSQISRNDPEGFLIFPKSGLHETYEIRLLLGALSHGALHHTNINPSYINTNQLLHISH